LQNCGRRPASAPTGTLAEAAAGADVELPSRLRDLWEVPAGQRVSELERLRTPSGNRRVRAGPAWGRLGRRSEARAELELATRLCANQRERSVLLRKAAELD
jgi:hypothetical protein